MPYYEYHCEGNGQTLEVRHSMKDHVATWGELAAIAGETIGATPPDAPVERLMSAPVPVAGSRSGPTADGGFEGCGSGCACVPQD
jgi:hypothetical protein